MTLPPLIPSSFFENQPSIGSTLDLRTSVLVMLQDMNAKMEGYVAPIYHYSFSDNNYEASSSSHQYGFTTSSTTHATLHSNTWQWALLYLLLLILTVVTLYVIVVLWQRFRAHCARSSTCGAMFVRMLDRAAVILPVTINANHPHRGVYQPTSQNEMQTIDSITADDAYKMALECEHIPISEDALQEIIRSNNPRETSLDSNLHDTKNE